MTKEQAIKLLSKNTRINEISKLRNKGLSQREIIDTIQEAIDMCIVSTEKQIAKKVIVRDIGVDTYDCPSCENIYLSCGGVYKYCPNCGQKLDLSEVE